MKADLRSKVLGASEPSRTTLLFGAVFPASPSFTELDRGKYWGNIDPHGLRWSALPPGPAGLIPCGPVPVPVPSPQCQPPVLNPQSSVFSSSPSPVPSNHPVDVVLVLWLRVHQLLGRQVQEGFRCPLTAQLPQSCRENQVTADTGWMGAYWLVRTVPCCD